MSEELARGLWGMGYGVWERRGCCLARCNCGRHVALWHLLNKRKIAAILYKFEPSGPRRVPRLSEGFWGPALVRPQLDRSSLHSGPSAAMRSPCVCHAKSVVNCVALKSTHATCDSAPFQPICMGGDLGPRGGVLCRICKGFQRSILTLIDVAKWCVCLSALRSGTGTARCLRYDYYAHCDRLSVFGTLLKDRIY